MGTPRSPATTLAGSPWRRAAAWAGVLIAALYLVNPTAGIFELLPDNLPLVGNIDEAAAAALLLYLLRELGYDLLDLRRKGS